MQLKDSLRSKDSKIVFDTVNVHDDQINLYIVYNSAK